LRRKLKVFFALAGRAFIIVKEALSSGSCLMMTSMEFTGVARGTSDSLPRLHPTVNYSGVQQHVFRHVHTSTHVCSPLVHGSDW
jgi:hypothetical protein